MSEEFAQAQTVTIGDLLKKGYTYLIPDYQRGYRWQCSHICDLMNDVWHSTEKDWNCIQPIIVSHRKGDEYTLVDGQQRLTTINIILKFLNENEFDLKREGVNYEEDSINIKFKEYAAKTVQKWLKEKTEDEKTKFRTNLKAYTKVIWYKVEDKDAIEAFTRININRIPLTAAELLKAMFLRKLSTESDFEARQIEISLQWNEIESTLQDDRFWLMFNKKNDQDSCRISRIFRIAYACEISQNKEQNKDDEKNIRENDSEKAVFRYFLSKIQPDKNEGDEMAELARIEKIWHEIENIYRALRDWYEDVDTFHLVYMYFIVNRKALVSKLYAEWDTKTRKDFRDFLRREIKNELFGTQDDDVRKTIDECNYKSDYNRIKNILLLHNVATTMLRNWPQHRWVDRKYSEERHLKNMCSRFPFHMYKIAKWNLEHISPCSGDSNDDEQREKFIKCLRGSLTDGILRQKLKDEDPSKLEKLIKQFIETDNNPDMRNSIADDILKILKNSNIYEPFQNIMQHSIKNLALLDEGTNKSYGNKIFVDKRMAILKRVCENEEKEKFRMNEYSFIMPCTLNAFSKVYSKEHNNLLFWGENDANDYGEDMIKTISHFLASESDNENN